MGRGDKKSLRGKIAMGSFGKKRARKKPHRVAAKPALTAESAEKRKTVSKPKVKAEKKSNTEVTPAKKKVVKKTKEKEAE